jgi:hypothetical protein
VLLKVLGNGVLISLKTNVADEQRRRRSVGRVAIGLRAVVAALLAVTAVVLAWGGEVQAELPSVKLR